MKTYCQDGDQQGINVLHYQVATIGGPAPTDQQLCNVMEIAYAPVYKAWLAAQAFWRGLSLQVVYPLPIPTRVISTASTGVGLNAGPSLPTQTAFLMRKFTLLAGPSNRGRAYLPFWDNSFNAGTSTPTAAAVILANAWAAATITARVWAIGGSTVGLAPIIWNPAIPTVAKLVSSFAPVQQWATIRRRSSINKGDVIGP